jgi:hypothetical protein
MMLPIVIGFGGGILLLAIVVFGSQWYQNYKIACIQKDYLTSLNKRYDEEDEEDSELEELIYNIESSSQRIVYYHDTLQ